MKGVFLSIALIFVTFLMLSLILLRQFSLLQFSTLSGLEIRANSMTILTESILKDSEKAVKIISKRAANAAINYVILNGMGLNNSNETILELMVNGTINNVSQPLMENSTLKNWKAKMIEIAKDRGFNLNLDFIEIFIFQEDSFNFGIKYKLLIDMKDTKANISFKKVFERTVFQNIENLEDPLYPLNTFGRVTNYFRLSPHWMNYTEISKLQDDHNNSYYHPSLNGASFLDRLEGKLFVQDKYRINQNYIGLESFINKNKLLSAGLSININKTNIDYLYFSNYNVTSYKILGMPEDFRLDNETTVFNLTHLEVYNATIV